MTIDLRPPRVKRSRLAGAALTLALFSVPVSVLAFALLRTQAVEALPGVAALLAGFAVAALAVVVGIVALAIVWRSGARGGGRSFFAILLAAAVLAGPSFVVATHLGAPALHDVSTDPHDPPRFERVARDRRRGDAPVPAATLDPAQAAAQRAGYPDLAPLRLALTPEEVSNLALSLVEDRGWRVLGPTAYPRGGPPTGRIEAVARTPVLGLESDVSIRVRPDGEGARVDMRSASRLGAPDLGANADRIKGFLADLAAAANAAP